MLKKSNKQKQKATQTRTKSQIEAKKLFFYVLITLGAVILFTAPLVHIEFSKKNALAEKEKNIIYKETIVPIQNAIANNRKEYDDKHINAETYVAKLDKLSKKLNLSKKNYKEQSRLIANQYRFFGWKTKRAFLIGFGIRLPYIMFCLIISYLLTLLNSKDKNFIKAFNFFQISSYTISLYVIIWCFWHSQDYPLSAYRWTIISVCGLVSLAVVYFINYRFALSHRYTIIIRNLFDFIIIDTPKKHITKEKEPEYDKDVDKIIQNIDI